MSKKYDRQPRRRAIFLFVCSAFAFAAVLMLIYQVWNRIEQAGDTQPRGDLSDRFEKAKTMEYGGRVYQYRGKLTTMLVMGIDTGDGTRAAAGLRNGGQADFLLLLVIDEQSKIVTPIQIDRDTMTDITVLGVLGDPAGTRSTQICLAHGFGDGKEQSCLNTVDAVSRYLKGSAVDYYMAMNLMGIASLNDMLGGVTVTLKDDFSMLDPAMNKGTTLTLLGKQAEYYVRKRVYKPVYTHEQAMQMIQDGECGAFSEQLLNCFFPALMKERMYE